MEVKFDVQIDDQQRGNNPQNGFMARDEDDIEELLDNMVIVGEDRDEDIQWDRVVDDLGDINSSQENNVRGVDQILRQDSRHGSHNQNPIRMWVNPDANEIEATVYRPGQDTLLSDVDAVEAFNQIFNNESAPTQTLQVAAEEHFLSQNSEALGSFEDISNIKWAIVEDEGAHGEEAPRQRGEHLTTDTNTQYDVHGFYIEEDGEPLEPEEVNSLKNKIMRRDRFTVPNSEPSEVPEIMLEYDSVEEAVSDRGISRQKFNDEFSRAQKTGLVSEEGNLTLKGWLSAVDMQARDVRALEEAADGREIIEPETNEIFGTLTEGTTSESLTVEFGGWVGAYMNESSRCELEVDTETGEEPWIESSPLTQFVGYEDSFPHVENGPFAESQSFSLNQFVEDYFSKDVIQDGKIIIQRLREYSDEFAEGLMRQADRDSHEGEYSGIRVECPSLDLVGEAAEAHESALESIYGITLNELNEELNEKSTVDIDGDKLSISYEGEMLPDRIVREIEGEREFDWNLAEINLDEAISVQTSSILLDEFREELREEHNFSARSNEIDEYQDLRPEIKRRLNELEDYGVIETDEQRRGMWEASLEPETQEHYRLIEQLHRETDIFLPTTKQLHEPEDIEAKKISVDPLESAEIDGSLDDEIEEEILDLLEENDASQIWTNQGRETKFDYVGQGASKGLHEIADKNSILALLRDALVGEPERRNLRQEVGPHYNGLEFLSPEHEEITKHMDSLPGAGSEELLDSLEQLEQEGLVQLNYSTMSISPPDYKSDENRPETEVFENYEGDVSIEYDRLDEEAKQLLEELEERGVADLKPVESILMDGEARLRVEEKDAGYKLKLNGRAEKVTSNEEVTVTTDYERGTEYEVDDQLRRVAESIDPLNFQKDSYEDVEVETNFRYEDSSQAAV
jgi:hypothetical protein